MAIRLGGLWLALALLTGCADEDASPVTPRRPRTSTIQATAEPVLGVTSDLATPPPGATRDVAVTPTPPASPTPTVPPANVMGGTTPTVVLPTLPPIVTPTTSGTLGRQVATLTLGSRPRAIALPVRGTTPWAIAGDSVWAGAVDGTAEPVASASAGAQALVPEAASGAWLVGHPVASGQGARAIDPGAVPTAWAADEQEIWVGTAHALWKVPRTGTASASVACEDVRAIALDGASAWVATGAGELLEVDRAGMRIGDRHGLGTALTALAADGAGGVWGVGAGSIYRLGSGGLVQHSLPASPLGLAVVEGRAWVGLAGEPRVMALDSSLIETGTYPVGVPPRWLAADARGRVWVASPDQRRLVAIAGR